MVSRAEMPPSCPLIRKVACTSPSDVPAKLFFADGSWVESELMIPAFTGPLPSTPLPFIGRHEREEEELSHMVSLLYC